MTLQDLFDLLADNPIIILFYFIALPLTAILSCELDRGEHYIVPWKFLYTFLIYAACIPGIFAITLSVYLFLFEGRSILQTDIYTQILPVASMIVTLLFIRKRVDLDRIPGFQKLSGLIVIIFGLMALMWILDRTRIWAITIIPFWVVLLILVGILALIVYGWSKISSSKA